MMDIQPTDLRYFFEIAKTLNISRAAERLNIGQPALSQSVQRLETVVGTRLLDRFKTGVQLTAAGRRLISEGQGALENWNQLRQSVRASDLEIEGTFTLGSHPSVAIYALPVFLKNLFDLHPKLEIHLRHALSREITEEVVSFKIDFGLVINPARHPDLVIKSLSHDRVGFFSTRKSSSDVLIYDPALAQSHALTKKLPRNSRFRRHLHSSDLEVIAQLAAQGCGVAILPEKIANQHPSLDFYNKELPTMQDELCLIYRADRHLGASGRAIIDAILRHHKK